MCTQHSLVLTIPFALPNASLCFSGCLTWRWVCPEGINVSLALWFSVGGRKLRPGYFFCCLPPLLGSCRLTECLYDSDSPCLCSSRSSLPLRLSSSNGSLLLLTPVRHHPLLSFLNFIHTFEVPLLSAPHVTSFNMSSASCWDPKISCDSHPQFQGLDPD